MHCMRLSKKIKKKVKHPVLRTKSKRPVLKKIKLLLSPMNRFSLQRLELPRLLRGPKNQKVKVVKDNWTPKRMKNKMTSNIFKG